VRLWPHQHQASRLNDTISECNTFWNKGMYTTSWSCTAGYQCTAAWHHHVRPQSHSLIHSLTHSLTHSHSHCIHPSLHHCITLDLMFNIFHQQRFLNHRNTSLTAVGSFLVYCRWVSDGVREWRSVWVTEWVSEWRSRRYSARPLAGQPALGLVVYCMRGLTTSSHLPSKSSQPPITHRTTVNHNDQRDKMIDFMYILYSCTCTAVTLPHHSLTQPLTLTLCNGHWSACNTPSVTDSVQRNTTLTSTKQGSIPIWNIIV
jgi:hypothetical protein